jgi:cysteine desulfurase
VEQARERVAKFINATPHEIIFTSGATEAINLAIKGVYKNYQSKGNHIVTVATEHKAVLDTCKYLEEKGAQVTYLPVNREGLINLDQLRDSINEKTILVAVMYANNETGVIQPISDIAKIVHDKGSILMSDATQAVGKIRVDVQGDGIDLLCLSAHKIYGPKGAGALFVRRKDPRVVLSPLIHGGGHERGLRSGTLNVPGIVGLGKACEIAEKEMWDDAQRISQLRTWLEQNLLDIKNIFVNGSMKHRLPNTTNLSFFVKNNSGVFFKADSLITQLPDIAIATGSACTSAIPEPSHVLKAMGVSDEMAYASIRFSLGKFTTKEEIEIVSQKMKEKVKEIGN